MALSELYRSHTEFPMDQWKWPSFSPREMACRGTGRLRINTRAMDMLQDLRNRLGVPMIVNSAYRSPEHNKRVGGAKNSQHMKSTAFDVRMDNHHPDQFIKIAKQVGFRGIGTYPKQGFVHIDARDYDARWGDPFPSRSQSSMTRFAPEPPVREQSQKNAVKETLASAGVITPVMAGVAGAVPQDLNRLVLVVAIAMFLATVFFIYRKNRVEGDI